MLVPFFGSGVAYPAVQKARLALGDVNEFLIDSLCVCIVGSKPSRDKRFKFSNSVYCLLEIGLANGGGNRAEALIGPPADA